MGSTGVWVRVHTASVPTFTRWWKGSEETSELRLENDPGDVL